MTFTFTILLQKNKKEFVMALLRQYINGVRVHTLSVRGSADDLNALKALMEGKIE